MDIGSGSMDISEDEYSRNERGGNESRGSEMDLKDFGSYFLTSWNIRRYSAQAPLTKPSHQIRVASWNLIVWMEDQTLTHTLINKSKGDDQVSIYKMTCDRLIPLSDSRIFTNEPNWKPTNHRTYI